MYGEFKSQEKLLKSELEYNRCNEEYVEIKHIEIDDVKCEIIEVDATPFETIQELTVHINSLDLNPRNYKKIRIVGEKNFYINEKYILENVLHENIYIVEDKSSLSIDLEEIAREKSLKGVFVKNILDKIQKEQDEEKKEILKGALEVVISEMRLKGENR